MYQALYRKYRPTAFDDVVGQDHITDILKNEVSDGRVAHAYLFTGSRGTGKTTCSKILAKAVNCPNVQGGNPCGVCDVCRGIDNGSITDVLEIDAASNNGVDNIRELIAETNFTPASAKYRIYIIDEAHMLSPGAANALLKTLEEPPEYVIFILATTEVHKIPATILSRCQRFGFKRIDPEIIAERVCLVAEKENLTIEPDAAAMIAKLADGGMRDALSLLDLCAGFNKNITLDAVIEAAGLAGSKYVSELAESIIDGDVSGSFKTLTSLYENSVDIIRLCDQLTGIFRNLMIVKTASNAAQLIICTPSELDELRRISDKTELPFIFTALDILQDTSAKLTRSFSKKTEFEMALVKMCNPQSDSSVSSLCARIDELEKRIRNLSFTPAAAQESEIPAKQSQSKPTVKAPVSEISHIIAHSPSNSAVLMDEELWGKILDELAKINPALRAALTNSAAYVKDDIILIDSPDELFLRLIRENEYAKESLREAVKAQTGKRYRLGPYRRETKKSDADAPLTPFQEISKLACEMGVMEENK